MIIRVPFGCLSVESDGEAIVRLCFVDFYRESTEIPDAVERQAVQELYEYFSGERRTFTVPVHLSGTKFQLRVWEELRQIPYGQTISYGELARRIGNPRAFRAVGTACGKNPVSILIPCHRVIARSGALGGYAWGVERKRPLLALEQGENFVKTGV